MGTSKLGVTILHAIISASLAQGNKSCDGSIPVKGSSRQLPNRGYNTFFNGAAVADGQLVVSSLTKFLKQGGRLIQTSPARTFGTAQQSVGLAVRDAGVPREEIWVVNMIETFDWSPGLGSPAAWVLQQVNNSLHTMGLAYLDLMFLHYGPQQMTLERGVIVSYDDHLDMWRGLIEARRLGMILNIGVIEHTQLEVENLMQIEAPAVASILMHPWVPDKQKVYSEWLKDKGIAVLAYGAFSYKLLGGSDGYVAVAEQVGNQYGATHGQVAIHWIHQQGFGFVTGLYDDRYMLEDAVCLQFNFTKHDLAVLHSQPNWPCDILESCGQHYTEGCRTPEMGPIYREYKPWSILPCLIWSNYHVYLPIGEVSTQLVGIKSFTLLVSTASLTAIATAIVCFRRRGVKANIDLSIPFLE